jgi:hypothetical protein
MAEIRNFTMNFSSGPFGGAAASLDLPAKGAVRSACTENHREMTGFSSDNLTGSIRHG